LSREEHRKYDAALEALRVQQKATMQREGTTPGDVALWFLAAFVALALQLTAPKMGREVTLIGLVAMVGCLIHPISQLSMVKKAKARRTKRLWFLAAMAFAATLVAGFGVYVWPPIQITPENIEAYIQKWCDDWHFSVRKRSFPGFYFQYRVGLPLSEFQVTVARPKNHDDHLQFENDMVVTQENYATLSKLSEDKRKLVREEISLELAKTNVPYDFSPDGPSPLQKISLQKLVPITAKLDEDTFIEDVKELDLASTVASRSMLLAIEHNKN
jgi:hypothetical protein